MKLDPKHLAQLSVIVEAGSFQTAADRLGLTQPGLSRNMKTLEGRIGAPLFRREGRRSIPTELGRRLARNGFAIRIAEEQASAYGSLSTVGAAGELRLGVPPIVAGKFLTPVLSEFVVENPECVLELRVGLVHELRSMLERGQIDVVVGPKNLCDGVPELRYEQLLDDRVGILCRSGHMLTHKRSLLPSDFRDQMWLFHSRGSLLRQQTEAALSASGLDRIRIACETDSIRSALEIAASTDLVTTMPKATTKPYLGEGLMFLPFDHPKFERPLGAARRRDAPENKIVDGFLRRLRRSIVG